MAVLVVVAGKVPIPHVATITEIYDALDTNADYDSGSGSVSKAEAYRTALRQLLVRAHDQMHGGERIRYEPAELNRMLARVESWIATKAAATAGGGVVYGSFRGFRG